jgi:hypothetical protein
MLEWRIEKHPILSIPKKTRIGFYWNNQRLHAYEGEMVSFGLFANGIPGKGRMTKVEENMTPPHLRCDLRSLAIVKQWSMAQNSNSMKQLWGFIWKIIRLPL